MIEVQATTRAIDEALKRRRRTWIKVEPSAVAAACSRMRTYLSRENSRLAAKTGKFVDLIPLA